MVFEKPVVEFIAMDINDVVVASKGAGYGSCNGNDTNEPVVPCVRGVGNFDFS